MREEFGKSEPIALAAEDYRAFIARFAEMRERLRKGGRKVAAPPFDEREAEKRLAEVREKLGKKGLPLLERKVLEDREKARLACLEYRSEDAAMAAATMPGLKFHGVAYRKYGGKIYAAGLGMLPMEALDRPRADLETSGKIVILDDGLRQELKARADANRDPANVLPADKVSFRWPFFLDFEMMDALKKKK